MLDERVISSVNNNDLNYLLYIGVYHIVLSPFYKSNKPINGMCYSALLPLMAYFFMNKDITILERFVTCLCECSFFTFFHFFNKYFQIMILCYSSRNIWTQNHFHDVHFRVTRNAM